MEPEGRVSATRAEPGGGASPHASGTAARGFLHSAALVDSADELVAVGAAFVDEGLDLGELPVLACPPDTADAVRRALGVRGGDVEDDVRICLLGVRAPDSMAVIRRATERALVTGAGRLRILAVPQFGPDPRRWREIRRYESVGNALQTGPVTAMCLYDRGQVPAEGLQTARQTHPELWTGGGRVGNAEYRDPLACLRDLAVVREPVEAGEPVLAVDDAPALAGLRAELRRVFEAVVPDPDQRVDLHLGISEVTANAFRHGRRPVSARVWADRDAVVCTITDSGTDFADPLAGFLPAHGDDLAAGGMGLWLARKLWDSVDLLGGTHGLTVRLATGLIPPAERRGAA